jgi:hypothetical protein
MAGMKMLASAVAHDSDVSIGDISLEKEAFFGSNGTGIESTNLGQYDERLGSGREKSAARSPLRYRSLSFRVRD